MVASGGLVVLPSWTREWTASDLTAHPSSFLFAEQDTLAAVVDTIIPAGNAIGALSVGVDKFLQKLIDKCYEKDVQENIKLQLGHLDTMAQAAHGKPFAQGDQVQRQELLLKLASSENKAEKDFFNLMKAETIRGFNTSKEVMKGYLNFKLVPGHYYGCMDVKA